MNNGTLQSIVTGIASASENANPLHDNDYRINGIWYCGNCNTPKQCEVNLLGNKKVVFCLCKCKSEEKAQRELEEKAERKKKAYEQLVANSMMDDRSLNARFESAITTEDNAGNIEICKAYANQFQKMYEKNRGMLFMGAPGTGKTYAAACIANALMDKGIGCMMTSFANLINVMGKMDSYDDFADELIDVPLLIIDDLGVQRDTSYAREQVYNAINKRYEAEKPVIITTNMTSSKEMKGGDIESARVFDRIFQMCIPVVWTGKSWRTQNMKEKTDDFKKELGL